MFGPTKCAREGCPNLFEKRAYNHEYCSRKCRENARLSRMTTSFKREMNKRRFIATFGFRRPK